jgi:hypothetical protein
MPEERINRKLAAIFAADVVGYSRLMGADCDHMATDLDQEVRNEEDRVNIHDPANSAYSTYAKATALRRDNLRRAERNGSTTLVTISDIGSSPSSSTVPAARRISFAVTPFRSRASS